jgi:pimeloyl-ACP methyl ester carboxylesterase
VFVVSSLLLAGRAETAPFPGQKKEDKGFDLYTFQTEGRNCWVRAPKEAAPGKPWVLRAPFAFIALGDTALLSNGFHIAHVDIVPFNGAPKALEIWDAFYKDMTEKHGLSKKVALVGVSRGGLPIHRWAAAHPERVACIVGVAPVCDLKSWPGGMGLSARNGKEWSHVLNAYGLTEAQALEYKENPVDLLKPIARAKIPVLHFYSPQDDVVPYEENSRIVGERLRALGGKFTGVAIEARGKAGTPKNPKAVPGAHQVAGSGADQNVVVDFIRRHAAQP